MENQQQIKINTFIINGKDLSEEEIQTIILTDEIELEDDNVKFKNNF
jgi:hypothetical protein